MLYTFARRALALCALLPLGAAGCSLFGFHGVGVDNIDVAPVENILGTATPLAYAATLSMAALAGSPTPCAQVTAGCAAPPCTIDLEVSVGDGCDLPIGADAATGRIPITGTLSSADNAELVAVFQDLDVGGEQVIFRRGAFVVSRSGDILTMTYGDQGLELTEDDVSVEQAVWTMTVDTAGTPGDTDDDTLELAGAQQTVINSSVTQTAVTAAVISPDCRLNPTAGTASITAVSTNSGGVSELRFHSDCDGRVHVGAAAGVGYATLGGDTVALDLFR